MFWVEYIPYGGDESHWRLLPGSRVHTKSTAEQIYESEIAEEFSYSTTPGLTRRYERLRIVEQDTSLDETVMPVQGDKLNERVFYNVQFYNGERWQDLISSPGFTLYESAAKQKQEMETMTEQQKYRIVCRVVIDYEMWEEKRGFPVKVLKTSNSMGGI